MTINSAIRKLVRERAKFLCEYCHSLEEASAAQFSIDHILPRSVNGSDDQNFFPMLRNWNENANESEIWEKLRLLVAHSTEDYGRLDINQSPFNVGLPIKLEEFTEEQVKSLAIRHGLDSKNILPLMSLVGGHPYLVRLTLYYLVSQDATIEELLEEATTDTGIYTEHLRRHLEIFQENQELGRVFQEIVTNAEGIKVERKNRQIYQLDSMGVIKFSNNFVMPRCRLYHEYFSVGVARRRHRL